MKTYLITGGAGFIGSSLLDKLIDSSKVIILDNFNNYYNPYIKKQNINKYLNSNNSNFKIYNGDIRDKFILNKIFKENKVDCVIHLAALAGVRSSIDNALMYQDVNCNGTLNLLEVMNLYGINKIVFASSSSVYANYKEVPFREDMTVDYCISPYASTKKSSETMIYTYHHLYNIDCVILRLFTAYGPRQRPDLAISKFTNLIHANEVIKMYGDGSSYRDYTYIDDIVDGIVSAINYVCDNNCYEIINIGSSNPVKLRAMIDIISEELGIEPNVVELPMQPGDVDRTYADITKAKELLSFEPKVQFRDGIKRYIKWYKENR